MRNWPPKARRHVRFGVRITILFLAIGTGYSYGWMNGVFAHSYLVEGCYALAFMLFLVWFIWRLKHGIENGDFWEDP